MADAETPEPEVVAGVPYCRDACQHHDGKRCRLLGLRPSTICEPAVQALAAELDAARPVLAALALVPGGWLEMAAGASQITRGLAPLAAAELARRAGQKGSTDG